MLVTASNSGGSGSAASAATSSVLPAPPSNLTPPTIAGTPKENETLMAGTGTWSGSPTAYAYQWERCLDGTCTAVPAADAAAYSPSSADVGGSLRVVVTASNAGGSASVASAETAVVDPAGPPVAVVAPALSGIAQEGETLTATAGSWSGSPTRFAYRWEPPTGRAGPRSRAPRHQAYLLVAADVGRSVRVMVTATNGSGPTSSASEVTAAVGAATPPENVVPPTIGGAARLAGTLTASPGSWSGPPSTYAFLWQSSADGGANWADLPGADSSTYVPVAADVGALLRVVVTATNVAGSTTASSSATEPVLPAPPANVSPPVVSGVVVEGGSLAVSTGEWLGSPTSYAYEWQRCDTSGGNCVTVWWAATDSFPLRAEDVGLTLRAIVTAANPAGPASAASEATAVVLPLPPVNDEAPTVSGVVALGEVLTAEPGRWESAGPLSYSYRWQRSVDGESWLDVPAAVGSSYLLLSADIGSLMRAVVAATNAGGSAEAPSAPTIPVAGAGAPTPIQLPQLTGTTQVGRPLNATSGTWSGTPTAFTYQWQRSVDGGLTWADLAGVTGTRLNLTAAHLGSFVRVEVKATNALGTTTADSEPVSVRNRGRRRHRQPDLVLHDGREPRPRQGDHHRRREP